MSVEVRSTFLNMVEFMKKDFKELEKKLDELVFKHNANHELVLTDGRLIVEFNERIEKLEKKLSRLEGALIQTAASNVGIFKTSDERFDMLATDLNNRIEKIEDRLSGSEKITAKEISELKEELLAHTYNEGYDWGIDIQEIREVLREMILDDPMNEKMTYYLEKLDGERYI